MALFRLKKDAEEKGVITPAASTPEKKVRVAAPKAANTKSLLSIKKDIAAVLRHPRVTEKATLEAEKGVYVFDISPRATKGDVMVAIQTLYKVTPRKINIVTIPQKKVRIRGGRNLFGMKAGGKKAYVYAKKGDTIDIV